MLSVSDLSAEQIEEIKSWVAEGGQMADVQRRLNEDFGFKVTYMDTRFLSLDLALEFHVEEAAEPEKSPESDLNADLNADLSSPPPAAAPSPLSPDATLVSPPAAQVSATLDQVARPGAMVSGTVTFSDGMKGRWMIDEQGRPSVDPDQAGYQPTEADLMSFQNELRALLDGQL